MDEITQTEHDALSGDLRYATAYGIMRAMAESLELELRFGSASNIRSASTRLVTKMHTINARLAEARQREIGV